MKFQSNLDKEITLLSEDKTRLNEHKARRKEEVNVKPYQKNLANNEIQIILTKSLENRVRNIYSEK